MKGTDSREEQNLQPLSLVRGTWKEGRKDVSGVWGRPGVAGDEEE